MAPSQKDNLRNLAISGVSWSLVGNLGGRLLQFAIGIVLARLLLPSDFGLISMVFVFSGFAHIFCHLGFPSALIYTKEVDDGHFSSVFWTCSLSSAFWCVTFWLGAPLIATFYDKPLLIPITRVLAVILLVEGLQVVPLAILTRDMKFPLMTKVKLGACVGIGALTIYLAMIGYGVWALVAQQTLIPVLEFVAFAVAARWLPRPTWQWSKLRELLHISLNGMGSMTAKYWGDNLDNMLIGRLLGAWPLGIYVRAYSLMTLASQIILPSFFNVLSPLLTKLRDDRPRAARYHLRSLGMCMMIVMPAMFGLSVTSHDFVLGVFGPKWEDMTPVLSILCLVGVGHAGIRLQGLVLLVQERPGTLFILQVGQLLANAAAVVIGFAWGLNGIAVGLILASIVSLIPVSYFAAKLLEMRHRDVLQAISSIFFIAVVMASAVWGLGRYLPADWPHLLRLGIQAVVGMLLYLGLLALVRPVAFVDSLSIIQERLGKRRS